MKMSSSVMTHQLSSRVGYFEMVGFMNALQAFIGLMKTFEVCIWQSKYVDSNDSP
jgi:hypothetical protein